MIPDHNWAADLQADKQAAAALDEAAAVLIGGQTGRQPPLTLGTKDISRPVLANS